MMSVTVHVQDTSKKAIQSPNPQANLIFFNINIEILSLIFSLKSLSLDKFSSIIYTATLFASMYFKKSNIEALKH